MSEPDAGLNNASARLAPVSCTPTADALLAGPFTPANTVTSLAPISSSETVVAVAEVVVPSFKYTCAVGTELIAMLPWM